MLAHVIEAPADVNNEKSLALFDWKSVTIDVTVAPNIPLPTMLLFPANNELAKGIVVINIPVPEPAVPPDALSQINSRNAVFPISLYLLENVLVNVGAVEAAPLNVGTYVNSLVS